VRGSAAHTQIAIHHDLFFVREMAASNEIFREAMSQGHSAAWDQQWDKAAAAYQKALEASPDNPKALNSLGLALLELQRYEEALQVYQQAAQAAPNDPVPLEKVGQLSERLGDNKTAIQAFLHAAELNIQGQNPDKALENWMHITQVDPENINAHMYLAMVHERLGHIPQATNEFLASASLYQRAGNTFKAEELIGRALRLSPTSPDARQAEIMLKNGQLLPKPMHRQGGTGALRMAQVKQVETTKPVDTGLDPIAEARKQAVSRLAEVLFDLSEESGSSAITAKRGFQAIVQDEKEKAAKPQDDRSAIMQHIGLAIDAQTKEQDSKAIEELEKALEAGFNEPALMFDLGCLCSKTGDTEKALRYLQPAVKHKDYAIGSRLLMAQIFHEMKRLPEAAVEYLEALKIADALVVPPNQSAEIRQLYEPLIEEQSHQTDNDKLDQLCNNVKELLLRPNWSSAVIQAREQLPKYAEGIIPLAEILTQAQSGQVIEAVAKVRQLARAGYLRSAMDQAFESLRFAPTYLPLHTLVGDLLIQEGRTQDAVTKYSVVAQAYSVRGEAAQAVSLFRRVVQVSPMDLSARSRLIDQLASRGQVDEAIGEYLDLADIYYRLADLEMARKTYTTALHLAQQGGADRAWSIKLLQRMADIDMQHLDWRQALRVFEQLRSLEPDETSIRRNLIELNIRLNQQPQAVAELENLLVYLDGAGRRGEAIPFLKELIEENPQQAVLHHALADEYRHAKRIPEAVAQLNTLGEICMKAGDRNGMIQVLEAILAMDPPNKANYQAMLARLKASP
jgi:tetratricopeptide (TPR) repeat protein